MGTTLPVETVTNHLNALLDAWQSRSDAAFDDMDPATGAAIDRCITDLRAQLAQIVSPLATPAHTEVAVSTSTLQAAAAA